METQSEIFRDRSVYNAGLQDDHIPFLERDVPVFYWMPIPYPKVWHKEEDNLDNIHIPTIKDLTLLLRIFIGEMLHL